MIQELETFASVPVPPATEGGPTPAPADDLAAREAGLAEREQLLAVKERRIHVREQLREHRLPLDLLELIDCSSDEAMNRALAMVFKAAESVQAASAPAPIPRASKPEARIPETYEERAHDYLTQAGYRGLADGFRRLA